MEGIGGMVRVVRCPKCGMILPEFADLPVYRCGGCNATLKAKRPIPAPEASPEKSDAEVKSGVVSDESLEADPCRERIEFRREGVPLSHKSARSEEGGGAEGGEGENRRPSKAPIGDPNTNSGEFVNKELEESWETKVEFEYAGEISREVYSPPVVHGRDKVRYVRCPKCGALLRKLADWPVYKCGGCDAILRAKRPIPSPEASPEKSDAEVKSGGAVGGEIVGAMSALLSSILDRCSSILERINRLWAVLGPSPPPYLDDLFRLEIKVLEFEAAISRRWGSDYMMEVEEAASVADDLLRELGRKLKVVDLDPVIEACNLYPNRSSKEIARSLRGLVGASREKPKKILLERQEAVFSDWIRDIRKRLDDLARKKPLRSFYLRFRAYYQISREVDRPPVVHGRDDDKKKVIELLLSDSSCGARSSVSVVWIVAAAGMGKTTLTHLVYNDPEVCNHFEIKVWVSCVSENIDAKGLLRSIVESLTGISCYLTEIDQLQEALEEELIDKRFLLVLDDVRHMDQSFWNDLLLPPLRAGAKGSIVVVTTRKTTVPNIMESIQPYYLGSLSDESCWTIFFSSIIVRNLLGSLIEPHKHLILSKCKGVPLIAKALRGLLRFTDLINFLLKKNLVDEPSKKKNKKKNLVDEPSKKKKEKKNLVDDAELENYTLSVLRLCYDGLPMYLKRCFVYCSLFPKGYIFDKDLLVRLWMSQGFILPQDRKSVEDIGTDYFNQLFFRSFFQYSPIYDAKKSKFVMHDLFHDLAGSASLPWVECLRTEGSGLCKIPEEIHHTSFVPCELETMIPSEPFKDSKDLLTFLLINRSTLKWDANLFRFEDPAVLDDIFLNFTSLRTLDLSNTNIIELSSSVENLKHLCYLGLNNTNIKRLPESICSLHSLQTLELQHCNYLIELPKDTKRLANLRHLNVWKEAGFVSMPPGIGQLTSLQTLSTFHVGEDMLQCGIRELKDLLILSGDLCVGGLESVISEKDAEDANLKNKKYLRTLTLQWLDIGGDLDGNSRAAAAVNVLQGLQPCITLQELIIRDYYGKHFPKWLGETSFYKLISITIDNCYGCNVLPPLGQLPSLKCLSIRKMDGVRFIGREFCSSDSAGMTGFPSLETLKLWEMYEWEQWDEVDDGDFPRLRSLTISRCLKLRRLPCFTSLLELSVHCCTDLPAIPMLPSLETLKIEGFQTLKSLALPSDLPALKMLEINYCTQLSSVVGIGHLSSVEQLKIIKCPKLQLLTNEQIPLMLQVVHIHCSCPLLREWCPYGFEEEAGNQVIRKLVRNTQ